MPELEVIEIFDPRKVTLAYQTIRDNVCQELTDVPLESRARVSIVHYAIFPRYASAIGATGLSEMAVCWPPTDRMAVRFSDTRGKSEEIALHEEGLTYPLAGQHDPKIYRGFMDDLGNSFRLLDFAKVSFVIEHS